jgi:hypothetical protein
MPMKYVAFVVFIYIVGVIMGAILDEAFVSSDEQADINVLATMEKVSMPISGGTELAMPKPKTNFFTTIWNAATFNFKFLHGSWAILKWIIFAPLAAMIVYGLVMTFINILQKTF